MIKEAISYIVGLSQKQQVKINNQTYSTGQIHLVKEPTASRLEVYSLSGMVEYIKSEFDGEKPLMVHVKSPTRVVCFDSLNNDADRSYYIESKAMLPEFDFDRFLDPEHFNIKLQSAFVQNDDRNIMLQVVGNIEEKQVNTVGDDGVSQGVTIKTGIATVGQARVPNPVALKPYRTFVEVEQPVSNFIFRMKSGPLCALFEADGGAWKLEAMKNVQEYLQESLKEEIEAGKVVVIA